MLKLNYKLTAQIQSTQICIAPTIFFLLNSIYFLYYFRKIINDIPWLFEKKVAYIHRMDN